MPSHCETCRGYEHAVLTRAPGTELPADVKPCPEYVMSDALRDHLVSQMRKDVLGQVTGAGLDRMGIVGHRKGRVRLVRGVRRTRGGVPFGRK